MYEKCLPQNEYRKWLIAQADSGAQYWYGAVYQRATPQLLAQKSAQYPSHYTANRLSKYNRDIKNGVMVGDCVNGAVKGAVWTDLGTHDIKYKSHGCPDTNADGIYNLCAKTEEHGNIDTVPDIPGILLHKNGHVGVTIGDGKAVEFRGFNYGCVITEIKDRGWLNWSRLPWVEYEAEEKSEEGAENVAGYKASGNVWCRSTPEVAEDNKVYVIKAGENIDVLKPCDGWTMIITKHGKIGYVSSKYIKEK